MAPIEVRNPITGVKGEVRSYDTKKKVIRLTDRTSVIDSQNVWEYYNQFESRWIKCFKRGK